MKKITPIFEQIKVGNMIHVAYISSDMFEIWEKPVKSIRPCGDVGFSLQIFLDYIPNVGREIFEEYIVSANKRSSIIYDDILNSTHKIEDACYIVATSKEKLLKDCKDVLDAFQEESFRRAVNYESFRSAVNCEEHLTKLL